jgi:hypothetical protein
MLANESAEIFVPCRFKLESTGFGISGISFFSTADSVTGITSIGEATVSVV